MIGAWIVGRACDRFGPRRTLAAVLVGWIAGLVVIASAPSLSGFWVGGVIVGLAFGGIWAAERPLMLRLSPPEESGRYFGLLALSARAAAIVGPLLWAAIVDGIGPSIGRNASYRLAVLSLSVMMAVALVLLLGVPRWVDDAPENALNGEVDALRRIP
jgi:UMF1 family MFS transporter